MNKFINMQGCLTQWCIYVRGMDYAGLIPLLKIFRLFFFFLFLIVTLWSLVLILLRLYVETNTYRHVSHVMG